MNQTESTTIVVMNGSKHHEAADADDSINHNNKLRNGNTENGHHHEHEGDECSDSLVRQKLTGQSPEADVGDDALVTFTRPESLWRRSFLISRMLLGSLNLISLCLKFPLIILIIRMVLEVSRAKASESHVTTIEPPYEDEVVQPAASSGDSKSQKQAMAVQIGLLLVMYVGILLVHVLCIFFYWMNKGLYHLFVYLPLVGMWLFLAVPSGFVQTWSWKWTNIMFAVLQTLIHGNDLFGTPSKTEFLLVRASVWLDLVTFILSCLFIVLSHRLRKELKNERLCCRPEYNLLKLL